MKTPDPAKVQLLHGPYQAPALKHGDRAHCLYRDAEVILTSMRMRPDPGRGTGHLPRADPASRAARSQEPQDGENQAGAATLWQGRGRLLLLRKSDPLPGVYPDRARPRVTMPSPEKEGSGKCPRRGTRRTSRLSCN